MEATNYFRATSTRDHYSSCSYPAPSPTRHVAKYHSKEPKEENFNIKVKKDNQNEPVKETWIKGTENENVEKDDGLHYQSTCWTMLY